jgi:hypothetical protein
MAWPNRPPNKPPQLGITSGYGGATDGVTAHCPGRLGDEPHRKPFGQACPRCERPAKESAA